MNDKQIADRQIAHQKKSRAQIDYENGVQEQHYLKHQKELDEKYKGKIIAFIEDKLYVTQTYQEMWKLTGNPGQGTGFIADLRD